MFSKIVIVFSSILLFVSPLPLDDEKQLLKSLEENIIELKSVSPGKHYKDLLSVKAFIGDKKIVLMGEATHGTKEFFTMKQRMFQFLVEEMGFKYLL